MYEGGIRSPFLARFPGKIKAGSTRDLPIYFPDLMPTIAETDLAVAVTSLARHQFNGFCLRQVPFESNGNFEQREGGALRIAVSYSLWATRRMSNSVRSLRRAPRA